MTLRTILEFPDPRLRTRAQPVTRFDADLGRLIDDMLETMYAAPGIGLAATQVDVHKRVIVIDISKEHDEPLVLVNPEILAREGEASTEEGCLSVPGIFDEVKRARGCGCARSIAMAQTFEKDFEDILAVCIQHEIDHLEGRLFVDYLSDLKRERIRKQLDKERRSASARAAGRPARRAARTDLRAAFAGTPEFALPALDALRARHHVVGVLTQPDRRSGRGRHLTASPVKRAALAARTTARPAGRRSRVTQRARSSRSGRRR